MIMKKLTTSFVLCALVLGALCIAGCTSSDSGEKTYINGSIADIRYFPSYSGGIGASSNPAGCQVDLEDGRWFVVAEYSDRNADYTMSNFEDIKKVRLHRNCSFEIQNGKILNITEIDLP
jgi:major membrane immunogen (membrane-anchored lipoprotein)